MVEFRRASATRKAPITQEENEEYETKMGFDKEIELTPEELEMPEEFEFADNVDSQQRTGQALNVEDLLSQEYSTDQKEQFEDSYKKLNPPKGDWEKDDRWTFEYRFNENDSQPGDINAAGRSFLTFSGKPAAREVGGISYQPMLFLKVSPDARFKADKPAEHDLSHRLWLKANNELFMALNEREPKNSLEVKAMLQEGHYVMRTMNGDNGPIVVDIRQKRVKR